MQDLRVSVVEVLGRPGTYRDLSLARALEGVGNAMASLSADPVRGDLRAESVVEGVLVTGALRGVARATCARCLTGLEDVVTVDVCELFVAPGHEAPAEEEVYRVEGLEIDLEPMLRDALTLALPLNPICRSDCKGLCAHCGKNLNEGPCDCTDDDIDPRWAALSELRDRLA